MNSYYQFRSRAAVSSRVIYTYSFNMETLTKKRKRNPEVSEPRCLIISPSEDGSVYYYSAPSRLITPEVRREVGDGGLGILFETEEEADKDKYYANEVAKLPPCLQALIGEIKAVEIKSEDAKDEDAKDERSEYSTDKKWGFISADEQWGGAYAPGPWAAFLAIYQWN